jgi:ketosteroid isomerase-like protein
VSAENVERLQRLFELVGDGENPDALYELLDPDVEMTVVGDELNAGVYIGHEGVRRFFRDWAGTGRVGISNPCG